MGGGWGGGWTNLKVGVSGRARPRVENGYWGGEGDIRNLIGTAVNWHNWPARGWLNAFLALLLSSDHGGLAGGLPEKPTPD